MPNINIMNITSSYKFISQINLYQEVTFIVLMLGMLLSIIELHLLDSI